jgi:DNA-binding cell septation regulator SpoVG
MEIHKVDITIVGTKAHIADAAIIVSGGITISGIRIVESKKGIYVKWPQCMRFSDADVKKQMQNRILATYIINHCKEKRNV